MKKVPILILCFFGIVFQMSALAETKFSLLGVATEHPFAATLDSVYTAFFAKAQNELSHESSTIKLPVEIDAQMDNTYKLSGKFGISLSALDLYSSIKLTPLEERIDSVNRSLAVEDLVQSRIIDYIYMLMFIERHQKLSELIKGLTSRELTWDRADDRTYLMVEREWVVELAAQERDLLENELLSAQRGLPLNSDAVAVSGFSEEPSIIMGHIIHYVENKYLIWSDSKDPTVVFGLRQIREELLDERHEVEKTQRSLSYIPNLTLAINGKTDILKTSDLEFGYNGGLSLNIGPMALGFSISDKIQSSPNPSWAINFSYHNPVFSLKPQAESQTVSSDRVVLPRHEELLFDLAINREQLEVAAMRADYYSDLARNQDLTAEELRQYKEALDFHSYAKAQLWCAATRLVFWFD